MKKILNLTVIALLGISVSALAQDKTKPKYILAKGTIMLSGRVNVGYAGGQNPYQPGTQRNVNFSVAEQSGFFVANNLSVGPGLGYGLSYNRNVTFDDIGNAMHDKSYVHSPTLAFHLRYYKMFTEKFGFFGNFNTSVGYSFFRGQMEYLGQTFHSKDESGSINVSISPNLVYFITKKFAIEGGFGSLGYNHTFKSKTHSANLGVSPNLNIGMAFYLGKGVQPK